VPTDREGAARRLAWDDGPARRRYPKMICFRKIWRRALVKTCSAYPAVDPNSSADSFEHDGPNRASAFNHGWGWECTQSRTGAYDQRSLSMPTSKRQNKLRTMMFWGRFCEQNADTFRPQTVGPCVSPTALLTDCGSGRF